MDGLGEALKAFVTRETLLVFLLLIVPGRYRYGCMIGFELASLAISRKVL